jgi:hypothetical protein
VTLSSAVTSGQASIRDTAAPRRERLANLAEEYLPCVARESIESVPVLGASERRGAPLEARHYSARAALFNFFSGPE